MNMYRRNDFKSWFADVGVIYLIAVGFVVLLFSLGSLRHLAVSVRSARPVDATAELQAGAYGRSLEK